MNRHESPPLEQMINEHRYVLLNYIGALDEFRRRYFDANMENLTDAQKMLRFQSVIDAQEIYCTVAMAAKNLYGDLNFVLSFVEIGKWIILKLDVSFRREEICGFPSKKEIRPTFERYQLIPCDGTRWKSVANIYCFKSIQSEPWNQLFPGKNSNG
jgi:hypothetical protein